MLILYAIIQDDGNTNHKSMIISDIPKLHFLFMLQTFAGLNVAWEQNFEYSHLADFLFWLFIFLLYLCDFY